MFAEIRNRDRISDWVPVLGSIESADQAMQRGNYGTAVVHFGVAVSDLFLIKSIYSGIAKGGVELMFKNYKWWNSTRKFLGKSGFAEKFQPVHHVLLFRNGAKSGTGFAWWAKNQMWNLKALPKSLHNKGYIWNEIHNAIEGKASRLELYFFERIYYGLPSWYLTLPVSIGGRSVGD